MDYLSIKDGANPPFRVIGPPVVRNIHWVKTGDALMMEDCMEDDCTWCDTYQPVKRFVFPILEHNDQRKKAISVPQGVRDAMASYYIGMGGIQTMMLNNTIINKTHTGIGPQYQITSMPAATLSLFDLEEIEKFLEDFKDGVTNTVDPGAISIKEEGPPNNDGRESCFWCGGKTKSVFGAMSVYDVCKDCGK